MCVRAPLLCNASGPQKKVLNTLELGYVWAAISVYVGAGN